MKKLALVAGALLAFALGALAQPVVQNVITSNECWSAAQGPGGPSSWLCISLVRNGTGIQTQSGSGSFTTQATTNDATYYWVGTAPTTWTVTTPVTPFDGELVRLSTDTTLTTMVTLTAATGSTLNTAYTSQTLTAVTSVIYQYDAPSTKWYRLQ